ncbi:MAG: sulfatase-like hydrolase/transferase [Chitinophagaceae bacterium]|nr:sulfatase-like hydrolase/transferase [Chitinophagaceae bacterium]
MKNIWTCIILVMLFPPVYKEQEKKEVLSTPLPVAGNLFIITTDGFRWQEVFTGADPALINSSKYTPDTSTIKMLYWAENPEERRKKLLPFFWNVIAQKGQVFGNRGYQNKVDVANLYSISYPGYNELFTGNTDMYISSNKKRNNPNINVLEYLDSRPSFAGKVAAFSSWDVFPYILNTKRNNLPVNSGYNNIEEGTTYQQLINTVQQEVIYDKKPTRYDQLTFLTAKEYLQQHNPRVLYLGLGETDEFAHEGRYDLYLQQASQVDRMIAELWHWVQTTPGYKDNTTFIITTDHGRGSKASNWTAHGEFISGSSQTWFAVIGPGIKPAGEIKSNEQQYIQQMAQTIAHLLGEEFSITAASPVSLH